MRLDEGDCGATTNGCQLLSERIAEGFVGFDHLKFPVPVPWAFFVALLACPTSTLTTHFPNKCPMRRFVPVNLATIGD